MATDVIHGLRTISRSLISRQVNIDNGDGTYTLALFPIPAIVAPAQLQVNPGIDLGELEDINCTGEVVIALTYPRARKPELQLSYSLAAPEMDTLIHGRLMEVTNNFVGEVFFEAVGDTVNIPGRTLGQAGYEIVAQDATSKAEVFYLDPSTKLARKISIVSANPTGDQCVIGAHMAITLSPELAQSNHLIRGWVPCTFSQVTAISAKAVGILSVKAMGIDFNGKFAGFRARNCSFLAGGSFGSDPKKDVKLRILPDAGDRSGLGYDMFYTNQDLVC